MLRGSRRVRLRFCRRERSRPRQEPSAPGGLGHRVTEQGNTIDVAILRGFLKRALEDDALAAAVNDLLFEHVVAGRTTPACEREPDRNDRGTLKPGEDSRYGVRKTNAQVL